MVVVNTLSTALKKWWIYRLMLAFVVFTSIPPIVYSDNNSDRSEDYSDDNSDRSEDIYFVKEPEDTTFTWADINYAYKDLEDKVHTFNLKGKYGLRSLIDSVSGELIQTRSRSSSTMNNSAIDNYGCSEYINPEFPRGSWIAFVERGKCNFSKKIKIATDIHNASAVVIYNNDGNRMEVMDHIDSGTISVFIEMYDAFKIGDLMDSGLNVSMHIAPGDTGVYTVEEEDINIRRICLIFVSISLGVLMTAFFVFWIRLTVKRHILSQSKERLLDEKDVHEC